MRILICNYEYPPLGGGGGITTKRLATQLAKRHSVTVLTSAYSQTPRKETINGVEIYRVPVYQRNALQTASFLSMTSYLPSSLIHGLSLCRQKRFDIINSHFAIPTGPTGVILSKIFRIPHVLSIHGGDIFDPSKRLSPHRTWGLHYIVQTVINHSSRVLAQSSNTQSNATNFYKISTPIEIIPHAIERPIFRERERQPFGFTSGDLLLITIGRLILRKAVHQLITLVSKINDQRVKLIIVGDGPEREYLQSEASRLGLLARIFFTGNLSDEEKFQLLNVSDIYVSAALHEGFGLVFLEAMTCGLPIVAFDNGGHTDFLIDGNTGFLLPVGDIDSMAEKVTFLGSSQNLRLKMGTFNKQVVIKFFIENCAAEYEKVFQEAIVAAVPKSGLRSWMH